jgi:hypothetical protein
MLANTVNSHVSQRCDLNKTNVFRVHTIGKGYKQIQCLKPIRDVVSRAECRLSPSRVIEDSLFSHIKQALGSLITVRKLKSKKNNSQ